MPSHAVEDAFSLITALVRRVASLIAWAVQVSLKWLCQCGSDDAHEPQWASSVMVSTQPVPQLRQFEGAQAAEGSDLDPKPVSVSSKPIGDDARARRCALTSLQSAPGSIVDHVWRSSYPSLDPLLVPLLPLASFFECPRISSSTLRCVLSGNERGEAEEQAEYADELNHRDQQMSPVSHRRALLTKEEAKDTKEEANNNVDLPDGPTGCRRSLSKVLLDHLRND